jgi:uncharacterized membrane protein YbaN (DUF454 family)
MKQIFFALLGWVGLLLGALGLVLPILPSTPFFLLAIFGFSHSHSKLSQWILAKPLVAKQVQKFKDGKGLATRDKLGILLFACLVIIPIIIITNSLHLKIFLVLLLTSKAFFLFYRKLKTKKRFENKIIDPQ